MNDKHAARPDEPSSSHLVKNKCKQTDRQTCLSSLSVASFFFFFFSGGYSRSIFAGVGTYSIPLYGSCSNTKQPAHAPNLFIHILKKVKYIYVLRIRSFKLSKGIFFFLVHFRFPQFFPNKYQRRKVHFQTENLFVCFD